MLEIGSTFSLSEANFLGAYDFGFGWLEWSAAVFSVLILMTIMIQEDWKIIFLSFWLLEEDWKIIFQSSWGTPKGLENDYPVLLDHDGH